MKIPLIDQIKIQAQVLVPLVKALQAELGEDRANALVRQALGARYRELGERWWRAQGQRGTEDKVAASFEMFAAGGALDYEVAHSPEAVDINVTGCRYARFYQELGVPELGFLLVCSSDFALAEGYGGDVELTRTQTIMQGASHCDFRYALTKKRET
jgi:predicted ArsR family transcriptional regulator